MIRSLARERGAILAWSILAVMRMGQIAPPCVLKACLAILALLIVGLAPRPGVAQTLRAPASGQAEIRSVRVGEAGGRTRIVLEADRAVAYTVTALADPPRLVVDLPEVRWPAARSAEPGPRGLATGLRFGKLDAGRGRLVVDVGQPFRIETSFVLPPSTLGGTQRIVVDIVAASAMGRVAPGPSPGAGAGPPPGPTVAALPSPQIEAPPPAPELGPPRPSTRPGPPPASRATRPVIAIDPGHGGIDPGTHGVNGADEKDVTLAMGLALRDRLLATGRYRVVMTRERDVYLTLRDRITRAREANAALFISLHADSIAEPATRGASVYTLSERASDAEAERLAGVENRADVLAGADLSPLDATTAGIILEQAQRVTSNSSIDLAELLVAELGSVTMLLRNTRRFAGFVVLKSPETPSVLVELGYLSNRDDARLLEDRAHRARLAAAIVRAVDRHFGVIR